MKYKEYELPEDVRYHKEHMWARRDGGSVVVGVTDFAQKLAGDIVYVDMPMEGDDVSADRPVGTLETGKWVGKIYAPLSGSIEAVNEAVEDDALVINQEPYGSGWIFKVTPSDPSEFDRLMGAEDYKKVIDAKLAEINK
jgi:glycine cleavage system H protein